MTEVPRDRWGRPLIVPVGGGKPVPYQRASKFGDVLEDKYNLNMWDLRVTVKGMSMKPHLVLQAAATPLTDRAGLNAIAAAAKQAAGANDKAEIGTAIHALTEVIDAGGWPDYVPAEWEADLRAYAEQTQHLEMVHVEQFMVCDEIGVAGTADRLFVPKMGSPYRYAGPLRVGDLKTSNSDLKYQGIKFATQFAIYAHSVIYDPATGERTAVDIDQDVAVAFVFPSGTGQGALYDVDIRKGWELVLLAKQIHEARKVKGLLKESVYAS